MHELPSVTLNDKLNRAKMVYKVWQDFHDAAVHGAAAIAAGHVPPINPTEPTRQHVYVFNSMFYSFAVDSKDAYKVPDSDSHPHPCPSSSPPSTLTPRCWAGTKPRASRPGMICATCRQVSTQHQDVNGNRPPPQSPGSKPDESEFAAVHSARTNSCAVAHDLTPT